MDYRRREFFRATALLGTASLLPPLSTKPTVAREDPIYSKLDEVLQLPVLRRDLFTSPVIIDRVQLLHHDGSFICKVNSKDGAEGISISNNIRMTYLYPVFLQRVAPFFEGKNALELDELIDGVYRYRSNYKFQSYALWVPVATVEFAILDMLGQISGRPIGQLIGELHTPKPGVYLATRFRHLSAEQSIEETKEMMVRQGYKALKFKIGERMGENNEVLKGRSEKLIALAREAFGDDVWLSADTNGGYDIQEAIRIGRILQQYNYGFYEEPLPFDWYDETKQVADALEIPVAGGEQEASLRNFRRMIGDDILQVVRPDMFYFGGMIRSMKVARMAEVAEVKVVPHLSGAGLGYLYAMHFLSAIPNAGAYNPCSKDANDPIVPVHSSTSSLQVEEGEFTVPTGPGLGVEVDPYFLKKHKRIESL